MVAVCYRIGVVYFPTPKVACTSIKHALFAIDRGFDIREVVGPDPLNLHVHFALPTHPFNAGLVAALPANFEKICVVRDPYSRFVSGYRNRVVHLRETAQAPPHLPSDPDINTFAELLMEYRRLPAIAHHFAPQTTFLGLDHSFYDRVFRLEELDSLARYLSARAGRPVELPHEQTAGPRVGVEALSPKARAVIERRYASDFDFIAAVEHGAAPRRQAV